MSKSAPATMARGVHYVASVPFHAAATAASVSATVVSHAAPCSVVREAAALGARASSEASRAAEAAAQDVFSGRR